MPYLLLEMGGDASEIEESILFQIVQFLVTGKRVLGGGGVESNESYDRKL